MARRYCLRRGRARVLLCTSFFEYQPPHTVDICHRELFAIAITRSSSYQRGYTLARLRIGWCVQVLRSYRTVTTELQVLRSCLASSQNPQLPLKLRPDTNPVCTGRLARDVGLDTGILGLSAVQRTLRNINNTYWEFAYRCSEASRLHHTNVRHSPVARIPKANVYRFCNIDSVLRVYWAVRKRWVGFWRCSR